MEEALAPTSFELRAQFAATLSIFSIDMIQDQDRCDLLSWV